MKKFLCLVLVLFMQVILLLGCTPPDNGFNKSESVERLQNPGIGFYRTCPFSLNEKGGGNINVNNDYNLHHMRVNLGAFSMANNGKADLELTQASLEKLKENIRKLYENEKCAIIRFAYDNFEGLADKEPSEAMILRHIEQVCSILERYPNTIVAIEVGMVGKWGEMHSSQLANLDTIDRLIDKFLTSIEGTPILVRTPKMIYHYLGISIDDIDTYEIDPNSQAYRLGIFNDGYLGSNSDLGTYTNREKETTWLAKQTNHLPYGGEVMNSDMAKIENCLDEMKKMHLSYLNYEWNNITTQQKWVSSLYTKNIGNDSAYYGQTAQRYIENHMGYRFLLEERNITSNKNKIDIELKIKNVGFGSFNKTAKACLIFVNDDGEQFSFDVDNFTGEGTYNLSIPNDLAKGEYKVYFSPYLEIKAEQRFYTIAFANVDMYDSTIKANLVGNFKK